MNRVVIRIFLSFMSVVVPCLVYGQTELSDSIRIREYKADSLRYEVKGVGNINGNKEAEKHTAIEVPMFEGMFPDETSRYVDLGIPDFYFTPGQAVPFTWASGRIVATGGSMSMPGLMRVDTGSIGVYESVGRFSFYAGGVANKYGYFRGLHTQYGLNGSISYSISPRLSLNAFGTYYFGSAPMMANGLPMPPSMLGYFGVSKFGGYVDCKVGESFGVQVGGQTVRQFGTNNYRFEPIVTPYVKVGKVTFGLPVGQIMNGIIRSHIEGRQRRR